MKYKKRCECFIDKSGRACLRCWVPVSIPRFLFLDAVLLTLPYHNNPAPAPAPASTLTLINFLINNNINHHSHSQKFNYTVTLLCAIVSYIVCHTHTQEEEEEEDATLVVAGAGALLWRLGLRRRLSRVAQRPLRRVFDGRGSSQLVSGGSESSVDFPFRHLHRRIRRPWRTPSF